MASRHAAIFVSTVLGLWLYSDLIRRRRHPYDCESQFEVWALDDP